MNPSAPVPNHTPVPNQMAPVPDQMASVPNQLAPVQHQMAIVPHKMATVPNQWAHINPWKDSRCFAALTLQLLTLGR